MQEQFPESIWGQRPDSLGPDVSITKSWCMLLCRTQREVCPIPGLQVARQLPGGPEGSLSSDHGGNFGQAATRAEGAKRPECPRREAESSASPWAVSGTLMRAPFTGTNLWPLHGARTQAFRRCQSLPSVAPFRLMRECFDEVWRVPQAPLG